MAISVRGVSNAAGQASGSAAASTVSIAVTLPASSTSGDRIFIVEVATAATMSTPSGWTSLRLNGACGSGTVASGSGVRYSSVYYRDYDGVWSMPTLALTSATSLSHWAGAIAITPTSGSIWGTPTVTTTGGAFNTATTSYTDSSAAGFTTHAGGLVISGTCLNDNVTSTTAAVSGVGGTFGTCTERCDGGTGTGNVVAGKIHTTPVTTGGLTLTQTLTLSAASQGETVFVEQTEIVPGALASTRTWDFSAADTTNWASALGNSGIFTVTGGQGVIAGIDGTSNTGDLQTTTANYDIRSSYAGCQMVQANADPQISHYVGLGNAISVIGPYWVITGGAAGDENAAVTRTHVDGDYYRIRESGGTFYYEYSTGGSPWTSLTTSSVSTYTGMTSANVPFFFGTIAGGATGASRTSKFDNFNIGLPISALVDDFNTGSVPDSTKWTVTGSPTVSSGQLVMPTTGNITSKGVYDLTGGSFFIKVVNNACSPTMYLQDSVGLALGGWTLRGVSGDARPYHETAYQTGRTHVAGDWYRVRESSGTLYYEYSSDGLNWNVQYSAAKTRPATNLTAVVGAWGSEATGSGALDNLNIIPPPSGTIGATLQKAVADLAGAQTSSAASGTAAPSLQKATGAMTSAQEQSGAIAGSVPKALAALTAAQIQSGTVAGTLPVATSALAGNQPFTATISAAMQKAVAALTGTQEQTGTITGSLQKAVAALAGNQPFTATVASVLQAAVSALSGAQVYSGSVAAQTGTATTALTGSQTQTGSVAATAQPAAGALVGNQPFTATIASTLQRAVAALAGTQEQSGSVASVLQKATAALAGVMPASGSVVASMQTAVSSLVGSQSQSGIVASILQYALGALSAVAYTDPTAQIAATATPATGAISGLHLPLSEFLTENFEDALNLKFVPTSTGEAIIGGRATLPGQYLSAIPYTLGESYFGAELTSLGNVGGQLFMGVWLGPSPGSTFTGYYIDIGANTITAYILNVALGSLTYNPTTMRWLRIGMSGNVVTWYQSDNGASWSVFGSPFDLTGYPQDFVDRHHTIWPFLMGTGSANNNSQSFDNANLAPEFGTISSSAQKPVSALIGEQPYQGNIVATAQKSVAALAGSQTQSGSIAATAQRALATLAGVMPATGIIGATLQKATAALAGSQTIFGSVASTLQAATANLVSVLQPSGVVGTIIQRAVSNLAGAQSQSGSAAATLQKTTITATGSHGQAGTMAAAAQDAEASVTGTQTIPGFIASTLQNLTFDATDKFLGVLATLRKAVFGGLLRFVTETPRIAVVPAESRLTTVVSESRLAPVAGEDRTVVAVAESRSSDAGPDPRRSDLLGESRISSAVSESRTLSVPSEGRGGTA